jgi:hypothetical protein
MSKETYNALKEEAKSLGLKYVGVSEANLAIAVANARNASSTTENPPVITEKAPEKVKEVEKEVKLLNPGFKKTGKSEVP